MEKIKPEERKYYEKIHKKMTAPRSQDYYSKEIVLAEFRNGTKIENNLKKGSIILAMKKGKKIEKFNLKSLLPEFYKFNFDKDRWTHLPFCELICGPIIESEKDLIIWMHEIGHAWDWLKNKEDYINDDRFYADTIAQQERNAWVWALKNMRLLIRQGFVGEDMTDKKMMDIAKSAMYNSAKTWPKEDASRCKFLNKEI